MSENHPDRSQTTPSEEYQRGFRNGLEVARLLVIGHQRDDGGDVELGAKNRVLKRVANKIYRERQKPVQEPSL